MPIYILQRYLMEERPIPESKKVGKTANNDNSVEELPEEGLTNNQNSKPNKKLTKQNTFATGEENLTDEKTIPDETERHPNEAVAVQKVGMSSKN